MLTKTAFHTYMKSDEVMYAYLGAFRERAQSSKFGLNLEYSPFY